MIKIIILLIALLIVVTGCNYATKNNQISKEEIITMVNNHAEAWKTGNLELLDNLLHEDVIFAYPGRRLNKAQTLEDLEYFRDNFNQTEVYINKIIVDGDNVAVEWQFATTKIETGERQVVSDAIIGKVKDGKFIVWKEYLDGRVKLLQAEGKLELEEDKEPFPWPSKISS